MKSNFIQPVKTLRVFGKWDADTIRKVDKSLVDNNGFAKFLEGDYYRCLNLVKEQNFVSPQLYEKASNELTNIKKLGQSVSCISLICATDDFGNVLGILNNT